MRVLLVNPPFYRLWGSHYNGMMLGIASLCAVLRDNGHDCWQLNADYEPHDSYLPTRRIHDNATGASGWHAPVESLCNETANAVLAFAPDVVGYTCFSASYGAVLQTSALVGQASTEIRQVIGGPHASLDPLAADRSPYLQQRFAGEAEQSLLNLLAGKGNSRDWPERICDLDSLPLVDRDHWLSLFGSPMNDDHLRHVNTAYISTARGCPYACAFCAAPRLWHRQVTYRSVGHVLKEFALLNKLATADIHVVDDTFTFHKPRALAIMRGLVEMGLKSPWKCESRADSIDEDIADAMAASGCVRVKIGFESGSERILARTGKAETKDQMRNAVRILKARGIPITGYWIAGYPGETDADLRHTLDFAHELALDTYSLNIFAPYPGSRFYDETHGAWQHYIDESPESLFGQSRIRAVNSELSENLIDEYWALSGRAAEVQAA